jgi:sugar phosphate isomerase/epimerase
MEVRIMTIEIGLSTWSLRRHMGPMKQQLVTDLGEKHEWAMDYPEEVSLIDFAGFVRREYDLTSLELIQMSFPSTEPAYLERLRAAIEAAGATVENVPIDVGDICEPDPERRAAYIGEIKKWMDTAAAIGSRAVRVNTGPEREGSDALALAVESCRHLVDHAEKLGLSVLIENHGGISDDPEMLARLIEDVSTEWMGACPDFGGFEEAVRYEGLEKLMPLAKLVHAKSYAFDESGEETTIDYARCMKIIKSIGFSGVLSIEYEGEEDQFEGIRKTKELITRYL